eukprot:TRINITY_DN6574_c0_g1_i1.p1 TRINITY_DN6574_c0_g1~~TRINITY_DN6574_c0_g1_i1.p1  ORF type:complete len:107 (-),score=39.48 TRINITY_DN6574_c0_g1_i1:51-371(-)
MSTMSIIQLSKIVQQMQLRTAYFTLPLYEQQASLLGTDSALAFASDTDSPAPTDGSAASVEAAEALAEAEAGDPQAAGDAEAHPQQRSPTPTLSPTPQADDEAVAG